MFRRHVIDAAWDTCITQPIANWFWPAEKIFPPAASRVIGYRSGPHERLKGKMRPGKRGLIVRFQKFLN